MTLRSPRRPQLPGCCGTYCRVVIGQGVQQLRQRLPVNQRREGEDRTHAVIRVRAAQPLHHVAGGDGIAKLAQDAGSDGHQLLMALLDHQSEDGHGANHAHPSQSADNLPDGAAGAVVVHIPVHKTDQRVLSRRPAQLRQGRYRGRADVLVVVLKPSDERRNGLAVNGGEQVARSPRSPRAVNRSSRSDLRSSAMMLVAAVKAFTQPP